MKESNMYKLHLDSEAFETIVAKISEEMLILPEIIEKDYFVTLLLQEVAIKQKQFDLYFKGGTALYKAIKSINRFSEDIDLTFNDESHLTKTSKKNALKRVTSEYKSLKIDVSSLGNMSGSGTRISVYNYETHFALETFKNDALNRVGKVKIETTTFTTSAPTTAYSVEPIVYTYSNDNFRQILLSRYDVKPFLIKCISMDRIFIDKLYAIEDFFLGSQTNRLIEMTKHMYDIFQLYNLPSIQAFVNSKERVNWVISLKEEEQTRRIEAKTIGKSITDFQYFKVLSSTELRSSFESMQSIYVFQDKNVVLYDEVIKTFEAIRIIFVSIT